MFKYVFTIAASAALVSCGGSDGTPAAITLPAPSTSPVTAPAASPPLTALPPSPTSTANQKDFEVGVYYYPGWHWDTFAGWKDPWAPLLPFPERKPKLGWYDDSDAKVLTQQADWMSSHGIDYVVFDWYYERGAVQQDAPLKTFISLGRKNPRLALLWANHTSNNTFADWKAISEKWTYYAKSSNYYSIDGKPVFFIFNAYKLQQDAINDGSSIKIWLSYTKDVFVKSGLPEPYLVAGTFAGDEPIIKEALDIGFSAISSYNYSHAPGTQAPATSYKELDESYRANWARTLRDVKVPFILPISSGWDSRPWGGYKANPARDNSIPKGSEFLDHVKSARSFMRVNGQKQAIICCWNEYGEGSYVEPTDHEGFAKLEAVREAFSSTAP